MNRRYKFLIVFSSLAAFALVAVLAAPSGTPEEPKTKGANEGRIFGGENAETQALLARLDNYEREILGTREENAVLDLKTPDSAKPGHPSEGLVLSERLEKALDEKRVLEQQQEKFINEILKLKKRIRILEDKKTAGSGGDFESREQELQSEVTQAHWKIKDLQRQLDRVKQDTAVSDARGEDVREIETLLAQERARTFQAESEIVRLKKQLARAKREKQELSLKTARASEKSQVVEQLEAESRAKRELEAENKSLQSSRHNLEMELSKARESLQRYRKETKELEVLQEEALNKDEEIRSLKRQLSKTIEETRTCKLSVNEKQKLLIEVPNLESRISALEIELSKEQERTRELKEKLKDSAQVALRAEELERELINAKNELLLQESEMALVGKKKPKKAKERKKSVVISVPAPGSGGKIELSQRDVVNNPAPKATPASDVMILEVKGKKVNLRSGPGKEHSPLMQVREGSRLTVEAREGDWYRVFTPTGSRAYVRKDVVRVIDDGNSVTNSVPRSVTGRGVKSPGQPARRAKKSAAIQPWGDVKIAGKTSVFDRESRAFEQLRKLGAGK